MVNQTGESHRPAVVPHLLHGYSAGWILRLSLRRAPRTDANVILQDVTPYSPLEHSGTDENSASRHWVVELVASPQHVNNAPSCESLPPNGIAKLEGPRDLSAGGIMTWENGEITSSGRPWLA